MVSVIVCEAFFPLLPVPVRRQQIFAQIPASGKVPHQEHAEMPIHADKP